MKGWDPDRETSQRSNLAVQTFHRRFFLKVEKWHPNFSFFHFGGIETHHINSYANIIYTCRYIVFDITKKYLHICVY